MNFALHTALHVFNLKGFLVFQSFHTNFQQLVFSQQRNHNDEFLPVYLISEIKLIEVCKKSIKWAQEYLLCLISKIPMFLNRKRKF